MASAVCLEKSEAFSPTTLESLPRYRQAKIFLRKLSDSALDCMVNREKSQVTHISILSELWASSRFCYQIKKNSCGKTRIGRDTGKRIKEIFLGGFQCRVLWIRKGQDGEIRLTVTSKISYKTQSEEQQEHLLQIRTLKTGIAKQSLLSNVKNCLEVESHGSSEGGTVKPKSNRFSVSLPHYVNCSLFCML